ncbi:MAG: DnaJ domain-containing protein [Bacteroidia bacterium]
MTRNEAEKLLGLSSDYNDEALKKAFKKLALEYHPDRNKDPGAESKFKEINQAFQILTGKDKPEDEMLNNYSSNGVIEDLFSGFAANFFGGHNVNFRQNKQHQIMLEDIELPVKVSFEESVLGCVKKLPYNLKHICDKCEGHKIDLLKRNTCPDCHGKGITHKTIGGNNFFRVEQATCIKCLGTGMLGEKCLHCNGMGFLSENASINVKIPPTGDKRVRILAKEKGNKFKNFASSLIINVEPTIEGTGKYEGYYIDGKHVKSSISVELDVLLFGGKYIIATVDGKESEIVIPPMTKILDEIFIQDKGVVDNKPGKHIVMIDVVYPNKEKIGEELKIALQNAYKE